MLPFLTVPVSGVQKKALLHTCCEQSVILQRFADQLKLQTSGPEQQVLMLNGHVTKCKGESLVTVIVSDTRKVDLRCLVAPCLVGGCFMILGMDGISKLGGVLVDGDSQVEFINSVDVKCAGAVVKDDQKTRNSGEGCGGHKNRVVIHDRDFNASFDGDRWIVSWKWKGEEPRLTNQCGQYTIPEHSNDEYCKEVEQWIDNGWLQPHNSAIHGQVTGVIPLMAAPQPNKPTKVRPVMDYSKELNKWISSNPGADTAICQDKLRQWRKLGNKVCILDLKKAYLQLHIDQDLQRFQAVRYGVSCML